MTEALVGTGAGIGISDERMLYGSLFGNRGELIFAFSCCCFSCWRARLESGGRLRSLPGFVN